MKERIRFGGGRGGRYSMIGKPALPRQQKAHDPPHESKDLLDYIQQNRMIADTLDFWGAIAL